MCRIMPWAILLLAALLVLPVAAETVSDHFEYHESSGEYVTSTNSGSYKAGPNMVVDSLYFNNIAVYSNLKRLTITLDADEAIQPSESSTEGEFTAKIGSTTVGSGEWVKYTRYSSTGAYQGITAILTFDSWTATGSGVKIVKLTGFSWVVGGSQAWGSISFGPAGHTYIYPFSSTLTSDGQITAQCDVTAITTTDWENSIVLSRDDDNRVNINYTRNGDPSKVIITGAGTQYLVDNSDDDKYVWFFGVPVGVSVLDPFGHYYTRTYFSADGGVEPGSSDFSLSLSSSAAAVGDPVSATLIPAADAPAYDMVEWTIADDWRPYRLVTGTWYAYNATTETYADAVTEAAVLSQTCQFTQEGNGPVFCRVYDLANGTLLADLKEYVTVSGTSALKFPLYVAVFDADSGATLMSATCQITNLDTSEVTTSTIQTSRAGETFLLDSSDRYQIVVSKTGYESRTWTNIRSDTSRITAYLPKTAVPGDESQVSLYFRVHSTAGSPVAGAYVQLSPGDISGLTNSQGQVVLTVSKNTTYTYQVSASGYVGATDSLEVSATSLWYECTLQESGEVAPPTSSPPAGAVTPDYRTIDQKAESALSILFENVELFAALAAIVLLCNMVNWIIPGGRKR